ncbi:mucin TcMUCII, putative [Trypanosoma cruzi]|nr:mucin TcMUCII, putative [Trypanosoma cruzi]
MMTCRLLCALLVLALCCCPSVFATEAKDELKDERDISEEGSDPAKPTPEIQAQEMELPGRASPSPETKKKNKGTESVESTALHTSQTTGTIKETAEPQSNLKNTQDDGRSIEEQTENTKTATVNEQNKEYAITMTKTTTTTTKTTTTTTAPEATSTTTTEAPTTTTTRAQSSLREVDGSLSISAWVCAPLLLAVSALAYAALG